jgi:hypothetical protein
MKNLLIFVLLASTIEISDAQNAFVGTFTGQSNGDNVKLVLRSAGSTTLSGEMTDSQQKYTVKATTKGSQLTGTAFEPTLNLTFVLDGQLSGNMLVMNMTIEVLGTQQKMVVNFTKQGTSSTPSVSSTSTAAKSKLKLPSGATLSAQVVGFWVKEENYNSGYGDNFMGGSFQQGIYFNADGSVSDGGSRASMSGANYSGASSGAGGGETGIFWYTIGNQFYLQATENGKTESVHLGKYFIENGRMLITGTNGVKMLLTKK